MKQIINEKGNIQKERSRDDVRKIIYIKVRKIQK